MGGGSSIATLSDADKIDIVNRLEVRYINLTKEQKVGCKLEIFDALSSSFHGEVETNTNTVVTVDHKTSALGVIETQQGGEPSEDKLEDKLNVDQQSSSIVATNVFAAKSLTPKERRQSFDPESMLSPERRQSFDPDVLSPERRQSFDHESIVSPSNKPSSFYILKNPTSSQLLSSLLPAHDDKVADLLASLKTEEITMSPQSHFRNRRLTFSTGIEHEKEEQNPLSPTKNRTTLFSSCEFGVVQKQDLPFPIDIMGTYSCHGIEPSLTEADGITSKINQDRGSVVHPFNSSSEEALFAVMDGHGAQGDKVAEFVMRQLVQSLEKDPRLSEDPISALQDAYVLTNRALVSTDIEYMTSGTTCVTGP